MPSPLKTHQALQDEIFAKPSAILLSCESIKIDGLAILLSFCESINF